MESNVKKNFIWNLIGSTVNSFTSLFFMIIVTRINGVDKAGIFTFAFSFALLMQVIGNYFGRSYQVTNMDDDIKDSDFIFSRFFTCFIMIIATIIYLSFKHYSDYKIIIIILLILFRMVESFSEILYGIIQKENNLYQVGISLFLKGLLATILFFAIDLSTKNLIISIISIGIVNLLLLVFYDIRNVNNVGFKWFSFNKDNLKKLLLDGFFVFSFIFLTQYVINASKYSIDKFLTDDMQTIYGIIVMPASIMALCSQFLIQPFLTSVTDNLKNNNIKEFLKLVSKICFYIIAFGVIVLICSYFLGIPVLELIYGINLFDYKISLLLILSGSIFFGLSSVISNCLIALRKNIIQTFIYLITSGLALLISDYLVKNYKVFGACLSYFIVMLILLTLYIVTFAYNVFKLKKRVPTDNIHTFVVLAYKESPFLEECLKSVKNQSVNTNVVIATTTKNKHISSLAKKYDIPIREGKHTSIGGDFDFAIKCGETQLITIAHQDDIYDYRYAEKIINAYNDNQKAIIIFSDYYEIRNNKKVYTNLNLKIKRILLSNLWLKNISGFKFVKRNALRYGNPICCPAVTFVKDKLPDKVFECDLTCNVDWFAWEKLSKLKGNFIFVNEKIMGHRIDETTTTTDIINKGIRTEEDLYMFNKFWPSSISNFINKFYKKAEVSNNTKEE